MADHSSKKVIIVGGSLGGLFSGIVFHRLGYGVTILERRLPSALKDQGAGISLSTPYPPLRDSFKRLGTSGSPLTDFLEQYDRTKTPTLSLREFQYLNKDGSIKEKIDIMAQFASWELLYNIMRANFDGGYELGYVRAAGKREGDGIAIYLSGVRVIDLKEIGNLVRVEYDSTEGRSSLEADIVVAADGTSSTVRKFLLPEVGRIYAGYVIWRGTVRESLLEEETRILLGGKLSQSFSKNSQAINYSIPGLNGSLDPAEILTNCVWYCNANEEELQRILTDSAGVPHTYSFGIGKIDPNIKMEQIKAAKSILPPPLAEVFQKIEHPFIQAVTDNLAPKSVFMGGKVFLVGDALAGLRPHTAAGTAQAAMNALLLKKVFEKDGGMSIEEWEKATVDWAKFAQNVGVQMGNLSQFGDHPMADNSEPSK